MTAWLRRITVTLGVLTIACLGIAQEGHRHAQPTDTYRRGMLSAAARSLASAESTTDRLRAAVLYLKLAEPQLFLRVLRELKVEGADAEACRLWISTLEGRVGQAELGTAEAFSPGGAVLFAMHQRLLGSMEAALSALRRAHSASPSNPLVRAELARTLAASGQADAAARTIQESSEHAEIRLVKVELAIRRGDAAGARRLIEADNGLRLTDPRWQYLADVCELRVPQQVRKREAKAASFCDDFVDAFWKHDPTSGIARGTPIGDDHARKSVLKRWQAFRDTWEPRRDALATELAGFGAARRIRGTFAWALATNSMHGYVDDVRWLGKLFGADAREALGTLLFLVASYPEGAPVSAYARELSLLMHRLGSDVSFPHLARRVRAVSLRPDVQASFAWHGARRLVGTGDGFGARSLVQQSRGVLSAVDWINDREVKTLLRRASVLANDGKLPVEQIKLDEGGALPIRRGNGNLTLIVIFDPSCELCADIVSDVSALKSAFPQLRGVWVSASSRGSKRWRKRHSLSWPTASRRQGGIDLCDHLAVDGTPACCVLDEHGQVLLIESGTDGVRDTKLWITRRLGKPDK